MKKARKILFIVLCVIVVLLVCIVLFVQLFGNSVLKTGIETAASKTLSVGVSIEDMGFSILGGTVSFQNLVIDNPPGYKHDKLLELGDARIAVSIGSLLKDTVNIKEIMLDGVNVVLEQKGVTNNNIQDIISAIPKAEPEDETEKAAKKLHSRVEGWRGKSVSSPRLVKRSMRFSRTTLTYTLPTKVYVTYRTGVAFTFDDSGLRT